MKEIKAIKFYKEIEKRKELNKYKLVNGLFLVKYLTKNECVYIGDFAKVGSALNHTKFNLILLSNGVSSQRFYKRKYTKTSLNIWRKLNIGFIEKPIKEILI